MSFQAYDATGTVVTFKSSLDGSDIVPHHSVDKVSGQTLTFGAGAAGSGTLRVILASDSPGIGGGGGDATAANQTTQITALGALTETAPASDTDSSGLNGRLQRIAQRLTSLIALLPAALGQTTKTGSLSVTLASNDDSLTVLGALNETAPASDTASSGLNGRLQRIAQRLTSLIALLPAALGQTTKSASLSVALASDDSSLALLGAVNETAPASDTASAGHNGRLQRIAQRLTSLIALLPAALGQTTKAASLSVALASDDSSLALLGAVNETAPASDTASAGHNGRLQRIAQRLTSLIALLPTALGSQTNAGSLSVAPSTDQDPIFDHANGTKTSVTTSATIITTGSAHKYLRIVSDVDIYVNTAGSAAVDDGTSTLIKANLPEIIPVPVSTAIKALSSSGTAVVRCTPMKVR